MPDRALAIALVLLAVLFPAILLAYVHVPYRVAGGATRFAPGYSEFHFQALVPGTPRSAVHEKLGEPLASHEIPHRDIWVYAPLDYAATPINVLLPRVQTRRMFVPLRFVYFDERGRVLGTFGWERQPLTAGEMKLRPYLGIQDHPPQAISKWSARYSWGMPTFNDYHPAQLVEDFALPAGSGTHKVRRVYYAGDKVIDVDWHTVFPMALRHVIPEAGRR